MLIPKANSLLPAIYTHRVFSLGSLSTEILGFGLAFTLSLLTIIFWKKLGKAKWNFVFGRIVVLILIQVITLSSIGIAINRSGEFYSNWDDLLGNSKNLTSVAIQPNSLAQISSLDISSAKSTPGGSLIIRKIIKGLNSKISDVVYIVLPPKIVKLLKENPLAPTIGNDYQILELFSGYPGVPQTWIGSMKGIKTLEELENVDKIRNTIAIIPTMNVFPRRDTECLNFTSGPQVETWLTTDMKVFAQRFLGIDNRPWASIGYSTGGWCATEVAVRHQEQYSRAVSMSGYFKPLFATGVKKKTRNLLALEYDLVHTLNSASTQLKLLIFAGKDDPFAWKAAHNFMSSLDPSIAVTFIPIPYGGHNTKTWITFETPAFQWINDN